jgi:hypothetical protein
MDPNDLNQENAALDRMINGICHGLLNIRSAIRRDKIWQDVEARIRWLSSLRLNNASRSSCLPAFAARAISR